MGCNHENYRVVSEQVFCGAVSDDEWPPAHGGVCVTDRCRSCGAERERNVNGPHEEPGKWGESYHERERREHLRRQRERHEGKLERALSSGCRVRARNEVTREIVEGTLSRDERGRIWITAHPIAYRYVVDPGSVE